MAYTVRQVAGLSGVSVRTLHFYDELGLLKPAYVSANGYSSCIVRLGLVRTVADARRRAVSKSPDTDLSAACW
jgi:hypothetical protein